MPEIKHTFTGGKMNKDHDERLIKSGEYRDAMNIQVTTSEGSDVGTMQNVLGNAGICTNLNCIPDNSYTVGSISDEKNDTLYWFVAGGAFSELQQQLYDSYSNTYTSSNLIEDTLYSKDLVMRKTPNGCEPVFVDVYGFAITNDEDVLGAGNITEGLSNTIRLPEQTIGGKPVLSEIEVGMTVHGLNDTLTPNTGVANVIGVGAINKIDTVYTPNMYTCQGAVLGTVGFDGSYPDSGGFEIDYSTAGSGGTWQVGDAIPITGRFFVNASAFTNMTNNIISTFSANEVPQPPYPQIGDRVSVTNPAVGGNNIIVSHALITDIEDWSVSGGTVGSDYKIITVDKPVGDWQGAGSFSMPGSGMMNGQYYNFDINLVADGNVTPMPPLDTMAFTPGTMLMVDRSGSCFRPYIDLPSNSPWLDEIYSAFFNDDTSYNQGSEVKIKANPAWVDTGDGYAGCIDWETTYDASNGYAQNGPTTNRLHMAQCDDFSIEVKPISNFNYLNLVTTNSNFIEQVVWLDDELDFGTDTAYFNFQRDRILNFRADRLITGINLIDDMLFWTDGHTEPKKINIQRSIEGTHEAGNSHTRIMGDDIMGDFPAKEENVTVIKKSPTNALKMEMSTGRNENVTYTGVMSISTESTPSLSSFVGPDGLQASTTHYDFSSLDVGDFFNVEISHNIFGEEDFVLRKLSGGRWKSNTKVVLKEFDDDGEQPDVPVSQYTIKATVGGWSENKMEATPGDPARVQFRIDFIEGHIPATSGVLKFAIDVFDESEKLFEFKFPRFSYRYKYADGEYSTFAPFTEVAFVPGSFSYHPKKGYNLGMTNSLKEVTLKNFLTPITPADVVAVDILYKDDQSPNIYVVDTVTSNDETVGGFNEWHANEYKVSSDIIHAVLPANQLLRPWDNVPRKAVAQEITKNRLVYGNYTQGYDLTIGGENIKPQFKHSLVKNTTSIKSIKSLREYQLGVVFIDKYGRETPVITNRSGGFKVSKNESANTNQLEVGFNRITAPKDMEYFKFFIKETSGEYYNMAMDRWYDADDGGVWLAFPSSDRNKIDEDTFLILKKGVESSSLVKEPAKYKVLAIENQAPDFIKTTKYNIGDVQQDNGSGADYYLYGEGMDNAPKRGRNNFNCLASRFNGTSLSKIEEFKDELYVEFYLQGKPGVSQRYKINSASRDIAPDDDDTAMFNFIIDGFFDEDVNFIFSGSIESPSGVKANARTRFYKGVLENGPKFDGKFFVKIYADEHFDKYIANPPVTDDDRTEFGGVDSRKIYYCSPDHHSIHDGDYGDNAVAFGDKNFIHDVLSSKNYHKLDWDEVYAGLGNNPLKKIKEATGNGNLFKTIAAYLQSNELGFGYANHNIYGGNSLPWWGNGDINNKPAYEPGAATANRAFFKNDISNIWSPQGTQISEDEDYWDSYDPASTDDYGLKFVWGLQNDIRFRGKSESDLGYEDVFFIDGGPYAGTQSHTQLLHNSHGGVDFNHGTSNISAGIYNWSTIGVINLGFGPIMPEQKYPSGWNWEWSEKWAVDEDEFLDWRHGHQEIWELDRDGSRYEAAGKFTKKLASGKKFHWLEDPTKTIYTLERARKTGNRARTTGEGSFTTGTGLNALKYLVNNDGDMYHSGQPYAIGNVVARLFHPLYYTGENFTQNQRNYFTPPMTKWEPTNYDGGGVGPIAGGRRVSIHANPGGSLSSAPTTRIKSITGSWTNNSFKVSKYHVEMAWDSNNGTTVSGSGADIPGEYTSVVEGMILTHLEQIGGTTSAITNVTYTDGTFIKTPLLIDSITEDGDDYIINIVGYQHTDSTTDTAGLEQLNDHSDDGVFNLVFQQPAMNGLSVNSVKNLNRESYSTSDNWIGLGAVGYTLEFLEPVERETLLPKKPAVWETEPKESTDLDIYYEASGKNPLYLNKNTIKMAIPIGSTVSVDGEYGPAVVPPTVIGYTSVPKQTIVLDNPVCTGAGVYGHFALIGCPEGTMPFDVEGPQETRNALIVTRPDSTKATFKIESWEEVDDGLSNKLTLKQDISDSSYVLSWHNCFSFGNGVESNRIRDTFNLPYITNGVKASSTLEGKYKEEHRKYGLIYSGIYNSTSGINNLNQFIQAEKITKDVNPIYGSIQKLHTRDSNLITLCEDKILKILAHKDALYNADGNPQLIATDKVLGQTTPFVGEYGISKNPESFASESYRAYFTDKVRGAVMRLSKDGLTAVSDAGMKDWFRDNLKLNNKLIGSYDDYKGEYNITLNQTTDPDNAKSVTYREDVRGWVSFKSFIPESGLSCANQYYTFKEGDLYQHHVEKDSYNSTVDRNTFYNVHTPSSFNVIFNDQPGVVKSFKTLNYEGSQSRIHHLASETIDGVSYTDGQYYNIKDNYEINGQKFSELGWHVSHIQTDLEKGSLNEFIRKEGKWFNYIKGKEGVTTSSGVVVGGFDNSDTSFQGVGRIAANPTMSSAGGCTDPTASNYNPVAVISTDTCIPTVLGCADILASNYNAAANTDDGSCTYPGCTDPTALNYDASANSNDGSCTAIVNGCTDNTMFNFDASANTDDGSCIAPIYGCMNQTADNYNDTANTDDGSCFWTIYGCMDANACSYDNNANTSDNSCNYCGDNNADNFDGATDTCTDDCVYCTFSDDSLESFTTGNGSIIVNDSATSIDIAWSSTVANPGNAPIVSNDVRYSVSGLNTWTVINNVPNANNWYQTYTIQGLTQSTTYDIQVRKICNNTASAWSPILTLETQYANVYGCTDTMACNYDATANTMGYNACDYTTCAGCTDSTALNYDTTATLDDGSCIAVINGCTDATQYNYDPNANTDDGSCIPFAYGCMDSSSCNYNEFANTDDNSCAGSCGSDITVVNVSGNFGVDINGLVFNDQVTIAWAPTTTPEGSTGHRVRYKKSTDTSWSAPVTGLGAGAGSAAINGIFEENTDYDFVIKAICMGTGCIDSFGFNNPDDVATINIGAYYGCIDSAATNYDSNATTDDNSCVYSTAGCRYVLADNYDPNATSGGPNLCTWSTTPGPGCTNQSSYNYDANATSDDGSCQAFTYGCTIPSASNYNSTVTNNDGSCIWLGCTDPIATNYSATATVNDGSCTY